MFCFLSECKAISSRTLCSSWEWNMMHAHTPRTHTHTFRIHTHISHAYTFRRTELPYMYTDKSLTHTRKLHTQTHKNCIHRLTLAYRHNSYSLSHTHTHPVTQILTLTHTHPVARILFFSHGAATLCSFYMRELAHQPPVTSQSVNSSAAMLSLTLSHAA